jgi:hypothetical protein
MPRLDVMIVQLSFRHGILPIIPARCAYDHFVCGQPKDIGHDNSSSQDFKQARSVKSISRVFVICSLGNIFVLTLGACQRISVLSDFVGQTMMLI